MKDKGIKVQEGYKTPNICEDKKKTFKNAY